MVPRMGSSSNLDACLMTQRLRQEHCQRVIFMIDERLRKEAERRLQKGITTAQVFRLMEKAASAAENQLIENAVVPIIEFFPIEDPSPTHRGSWHVFSSKAHPGVGELQESLHRAHGIYIFHDSSGCAIYAGKALQQTRWSEIKQAFNRQCGDVQSIKRVDRQSYRPEWHGQKERQIKRILWLYTKLPDT